MKYINDISTEEVQYICNTIPNQDVLAYIKQYPKEFHKLSPGFRISFLKPDETGNFLFKHRNSKFIASFLNKHIERWLKEINDCIEQEIESGKTYKAAWMKVLPQSFFSNNVALYFILSENNEISHEEIELLSEFVKQRAQDIDEFKKKSETRKVKELNEELERITNENNVLLTQYRNQISQKNQKLKEIEEALSSAEEKSRQLIQINETYEDDIRKLKNDKETLKTRCDSILKELDDKKKALQVAKKDSDELLDKISTMEELQNAKKRLRNSYCHSVRPESLESFEEFLEYNFSDVGLNVNSDEVYLLMKHLSRTLFMGRPIVTNKTAAYNLAKCINNVICGENEICILDYSKGIEDETITSFLNDSKRVVLINDFIGYIDENRLFNIVKYYRDKIIFIGVSYDKTLGCIPNELLEYYQYLSVSRIDELCKTCFFSEDPSVVIETEDFDETWHNGNRYQIICREIMQELGFSFQAIKRILGNIADEMGLVEELIFEVLPYCKDVLCCEPYLESSRLEKYTESCRYKNIIKEWFDI